MERYLNIFIICCAILFCGPVEASVVKKSRSGICHDEHSTYYERTMHFQTFNSLKSCIDSGGRLPKNYSKDTKYNKANSSENTYVSKKASKYSRNEFGSGWADEDGDCQNSRMEALISQSLVQVKFKTDRKCKVESGKWVSSFSGKTIFKASEIDIDHVVPLSWSWKHGANKWTREKRKRFANDPSNLISVEASLNRSKGDKGPVEWLPPKNKCQYILRFQRIYKSYKLNLSNEEVKKHSLVRANYCD